MTRAEHLQWAKDRAIEYVDAGELQNAFMSFQSDMTKHDELRQHSALPMMTVQLLGGFLDNPTSMRNFIEGFN